MNKRLWIGVLAVAVIGLPGTAVAQSNQFKSCVQVSASTLATKGGRVCAGNGSPESSLVGWVGDIYLRRDGGTGTVLYVKESGAGTDTGWVVSGSGGGGGGATITGSTGQVLVNASGDGAGDAGMTYDAATDVLTLLGSVTTPYVGLPAGSAPSPATAKLYNVGGTLYFNGAAVGGSGGSGLTSEWKWVRAAKCDSAYSGTIGADLQADKTLATPSFYCYSAYHQPGSASFTDASEQALVYTLLLPPDWDSSQNLVVEGLWTTQSVGDVSKSAVWTFATACLADGDADATLTFNSGTSVVSAAKATTDKMIRFTSGTIDKTGCAAGKWMALRVSRNPAHTSDNLGATAGLVGFGFKLFRQ